MAIAKKFYDSVSRFSNDSIRISLSFALTNISHLHLLMLAVFQFLIYCVTLSLSFAVTLNTHLTYCNNIGIRSVKQQQQQQFDDWINSLYIV